MCSGSKGRSVSQMGRVERSKAEYTSFEILEDCDWRSIFGSENNGMLWAFGSTRRWTRGRATAACISSGCPFPAALHTSLNAGLGVAGRRGVSRKPVSDLVVLDFGRYSNWGCLSARERRESAEELSRTKDPWLSPSSAKGLLAMSSRWARIRLP